LVKKVARDFFKLKLTHSKIASFIVFLLAFNSLIFLFCNIDLSVFKKSPFSFDIFLHVLFFTIWQAFLSAAFSLFTGILAAPGYASLSLRVRRYARWVLLLPNLMSSVLVVLCLVLSFQNFPFGLTGIIIGHVFLNAGLCTVWLGENWHTLESKWGPSLKVMGASSFHGYSKVILPMLWPQVRNTFAVVFSSCIASFAIPLVLGGGPQASTLEVLIFETIHTTGDPTWAVCISIVQAIIQIFIFSFVIGEIKFSTSGDKICRNRVSLNVFGLIVVCAISLWPVLRFFQVSFNSLLTTGLASNFLHDADFLNSAANSLKAASIVFVLTVILLFSLLTFGWQKFTPRLPVLSGVVTGLAGIIIFKLGGRSAPIIFLSALVWGHMSVIFLQVLRLALPSLESLRVKFSKVNVQLGASDWLVFKRIYFKLGLKPIFAAGGLAFCWSMGDFSIARVYGLSQKTLPIYIQDLMGSYRLEQSAAASLLLMALTLVALILMETLSDGLG
jgi:thiamine transport system permease protein